MMTLIWWLPALLLTCGIVSIALYIGSRRAPFAEFVAAAFFLLGMVAVAPFWVLSYFLQFHP